MQRPSISTSWPWALTTVTVIAGIGVPVWTRDLEAMSRLGDFFSGIAGTLAFIWLVAAYLMQGKELALQRRELSLQREAMEHQRNEWKKIGKYAALEQVARILDQYDSSLASGPIENVRSSTDLQAAYMNGMKLWKTILESSNLNEVFDAYGKWALIDASCEEFLNRFVSAVELYEGASETHVLTAGGSAIDRISATPIEALNVPVIRHYVGAAKAVAQHLAITAPGRDRLQLKGLEATNKLVPGVVRPEALEAARAKVKEHDDRRKHV